MKHGKTFVSLLVVGMLVIAACDQKAPAPAEPKAQQNKKADCHDEHDHGAGPPIELGVATAAGFTIKAARDNFPIKPACDAPTDVWITGGSAKVKAVRFWIGTEDAKGSIKALAEIENPAEPNHWHTHAEIPDPIPAGSKLWVEVEAEGGAKGTASFDLKT